MSAPYMTDDDDDEPPPAPAPAPKASPKGHDAPLPRSKYGQWHALDDDDAHPTTAVDVDADDDIQAAPAKKAAKAKPKDAAPHRSAAVDTQDDRAGGKAADKAAAGVRRKKAVDPLSLWVQMQDSDGVLRFGSLSAGVSFQCDDGPSLLSDADREHLMSLSNNAEKRKANGYALFVKEKRATKVDGKSINLDKIGPMWRALSEEEQNRYNVMSENARPEAQADEPKKKARTGKKARKTPQQDDSDDDGEVSDAPDDEGDAPKPKKTITAYQLFVADKTVEFTANKTFTNKRAIQQECRKLWDAEGAGALQAEYKSRLKAKKAEETDKGQNSENPAKKSKRFFQVMHWELPLAAAA